MSRTAKRTLGEVAEHFRLPTWKIRRLFERGILPPAERIGLYRVVAAKDLPKIEAALHKAGYLPARDLAVAPAT